MAMLAETGVGGAGEEAIQKMWWRRVGKEALWGSTWLPSGCKSLNIPQLHPSADSRSGFLPDISCFLGPPSPLLSNLPPSAAHLAGFFLPCSKSAKKTPCYLASQGSHNVPASDGLLPGGEMASIRFSIPHSLDFLSGTWLGP